MSEFKDLPAFNIFSWFINRITWLNGAFFQTLTSKYKLQTVLFDLKMYLLGSLTYDGGRSADQLMGNPSRFIASQKYLNIMKKWKL